MKIDRREFLYSLLGTASLSALSTPARASSLLDSVAAGRLASDPRRPQFHLLPAANWMNDPNGPIYWNGSYHMFLQYNPNAAVWGDMHWYHSVSKDLVHWKHLPVALAPTPGGPDADGCFSGTAVVREGQVVLLYTGVRSVPEAEATIKDGAHSLRETQCMAVANDPELLTWTKVPAPVIAAPPPELEVNGFRDPSPWRQGDWWYTVLGSGIANQGGAVLLYRSRDLRSWEFVHILAHRNGGACANFDPFDLDEVWECPEFFALGGRHVLIYSTVGRSFWQSGRLDEEKMTFHPEQAGILDYGSFYAPKTQQDKAGNRIIWGWVQETRSQEELKAAGWAGMVSLPRRLTLDVNGRLVMRVAAEVNQLRQREQTLNIGTDEERNRRQLAAMSLDGCCGEALCRARRTGKAFELHLAGSEENAAPWLRLKYDPHHPGEITIDSHPVPLALGEREDLSFHFYVDGSVIEMFVNDRVACTRRFYPSGTTAGNLHFKWIGSTAEMASFSTWQMASISADRLTS
jgi:beta-fructofuranosidase